MGLFIGDACKKQLLAILRVTSTEAVFRGQHPEFDRNTDYLQNTKLMDSEFELMTKDRLGSGATCILKKVASCVGHCSGLSLLKYHPTM
jgi:hypothetical protein